MAEIEIDKKPAIYDDPEKCSEANTGNGCRFVTESRRCSLFGNQKLEEAPGEPTPKGWPTVEQLKCWECKAFWREATKFRKREA